MAELGLMIEAQEGLDWALWRQIASDADRLGFASLRTSDHCMSVFGVRERRSLPAWPALARSLLGTGVSSPAVFEAAAGEALPHDAALAAQLYAAAGRPAPIPWATAAALAGDLDTALRIADEVVATGPPAQRPAAARVAAAALAQRGQLGHSAELYRWSGAPDLATVGLIATGRLVPVPPPEDEPPTLLASAAALMADGVRESVTGGPIQWSAGFAAPMRTARIVLPAARYALTVI